MNAQFGDAVPLKAHLPIIDIIFICYTKSAPSAVTFLAFPQECHLLKLLLYHIMSLQTPGCLPFSTWKVNQT